MALINCPECGKEISDKAVSCPNCGCPITSSQEKTDDSKVIETNNKIEKSQSVQSKKIVSIVSVAIAVVAIIVIAIFVGKNISKKNAQAKKDQQIQEVKNAMDNVDSSLGDLFTAMVPDEPFLYGDSSSDTYKTKITGILDTITENQKIVEDAYKNEDRDFIKELDDYISTNKTYRSWDEYNAEIKKLYGDSISNEQAADSLVKKMASSEEEYRDFKNHYFYLKDYDGGELIDLKIENVFDERFDFTEMKSTLTGHTEPYRYITDSMYVVYLGDKHPKEFSAKFYLIGSKDNVIATADRTLGVEVNGSDGSTTKEYYDSTGTKHDIEEIQDKGFSYGDYIKVNIWFWGDVVDTPTDVIMEVKSAE